MTAGRLTVGIDVGSTNVKAALVEFDGTPRVVARAGAPYPTARPRPGWVEQAPSDWWRAACEALRALGPGVGEAVAVSVSGQGSTFAICPAEPDAASTAISWQDTRAVEDAQSLDRELRALLDRAHGNATGDAPEPKLRWLRDETDATSGPALSVASWIQLRLGGAALVSEADAGTWMSWNRHERKWDAELAARLGVEPFLPEVACTGRPAGHVGPRAGAETGLAVGTPIVVGTSDVAAAALSAGVGEPGEVAYSKGTGGFACCYTEPLLDPGPLLALPGALPGSLQLCGATNAVGAAWDWARQMVGGVPHDAGERLAEAVAGHAAVFLPWLSGAAHPTPAQRARASYVGLSLETGPGSLLRAVLEGTAAELRRQLAVAREVAGREFHLLVSTGGPTRSSLWNRLDAAAAEIPLIVAPLSDAAVGCALVAAEGTGLVESALRCGRSLRGRGQPYAPEPELVSRARETAEALEPVRRLALELA